MPVGSFDSARVCLHCGLVTGIHPYGFGAEGPGHSPTFRGLVEMARDNRPICPGQLVGLTADQLEQLRCVRVGPTPDPAA